MGIKVNNQAAYDKRFGNATKSPTKNGGMTRTGLGKLASSGVRPSKKSK